MVCRCTRGKTREYQAYVDMCLNAKLELMGVNGGLWLNCATRMKRDGTLTVSVILTINWQRSNREDKLLWIGNRTGNFIVKECYELTSGDRLFNATGFAWKRFWNINLHERLWRILSNALSTRQLITSSLGEGDSSCVLCVLEEESATHLFKDCHAARALAFGCA